GVRISSCAPTFSYEKSKAYKPDAVWLVIQSKLHLEPHRNHRRRFEPSGFGDRIALFFLSVPKKCHRPARPVRPKYRDHCRKMPDGLHGPSSGASETLDC